MSEEILINVTPPETRVAVIENGVLQELIIERSRERGLVGNIYKGEVCRVLPGMQAAFVDMACPRPRLFIFQIYVRRIWKKKVRMLLSITCMKVSLLLCRWLKIRWETKVPV